MMAVEEKGHGKSIEDLEKEITCAICHEHYTDPKLLPCLHYYCKQCIHTLALRTGIDKPFPCPECRTDTTLPQEGVDHLKPAFFVNRMKSIHSNLSKVHGKVEAMCENCSGDKAEAFCRQCAEFICTDCVRSHQRMKTFTGHKTVSLDELKEGGAKDIVVPDVPLKMCEEHDEQVKVYCFDCNCLICLYCTMQNHNGHNHKFVKKAAPVIKKELLEQLGTLKEIKASFLHAVGEIKSTKSEVKVQVNSVTEHIKTSFNELRQILANRERELLKETTAKEAQKLEKLSAQEKKLSISSAVIQSVIEYTKQCLEHSADDEVMCKRVEMQNRIEEEIKERNCEKDCLEPVEQPDIGLEVSCVEDLKQLCLMKVKLIKLTAKYSISGEGIKSAEVNKTSEFCLTAQLSDGKQSKRVASLECHVKSLVSGSTIKGKVDIRDNTCHIQFTPTVRGRHEVVLTAGGQELAGSPFPLFVSANPTQLVKPVWAVPLGCRPYDVAVNSAGKMIVKRNNDLTVYDRQGKQSSTVSMKDEYGLYPWGMAIDGEGYIYASGCNDTDHVVLKLAPELELVKRVKIRIDDANFRCLMFYRGELMVCNVRNGDIMVITKELEFVKKFDGLTKGTGDIRDMSSDCHGNLYICTSNSAIQVFSSSGQFLRSFGENRLGYPRGVCVVGGYVYVTDSTNHAYDMFVYTTEGKQVTSFRQHAKCAFTKPWGVSSDKDGFIYVCDSDNKRIVVF